MYTRSIEHKFWHFFSYLFHPLFVPVYITCFLLYYNNNLFIKNPVVAQQSLLLNVFINLVFFQAFTVFLLKQLKFINSIYLHTQKERIAPLFIYTVFTFWTWAFVLMKNPANQTGFSISKEAADVFMKDPIGYPKIAIQMGLAFFITASLTLVLNSFYKISLHMIGTGLMLGISIVCFVKLNTNFMFILFAALIALTTYLSRKKISNHSNFEMYGGFMLGLITMLVIQFFF